jgi:hypothetical protein
MSKFNIGSIKAKKVVVGDNNIVITQFVSENPAAKISAVEQEVLDSIFQNAKTETERKQVAELVASIFQNTDSVEERQRVLDSLKAIQSETAPLEVKKDAVETLQAIVKPLGSFLKEILGHVIAIYIMEK